MTDGYGVTAPESGIGSGVVLLKVWTKSGLLGPSGTDGNGLELSRVVARDEGARLAASTNVPMANKCEQRAAIAKIRLIDRLRKLGFCFKMSVGEGVTFDYDSRAD